ncbi:MAG TPA: cupin domain-containing protein [Ignavibacteriaceae bacterium]|nr:cupin domain-containing protein [Ignavibacteriaceae bacterium]
MEFKNLLTSPLAAAENTEVVVSEVTLLPNIELPKHWHPGEEFAYIIQGSLTIWIENNGEKKYNKGDVCVVPMKKVHSVRTSDEGVTVLVFRVHEKGLEERYLVD